MRALLAIHLAIWWAGLTGAAEVPKHPKDLQSLVDRVPLAPPELAADILIRIATSGRVTDKTWKIEMLEDAFQLAGHATYPIRIVGAVPQANVTDSDIGVLWAALDEKLDALALRCRIAHIMLELDKKRALEMFAEVSLRIPQLSCADPITYSPEIYYSTMRDVLEQALGDREWREGKAFIVLEGNVRQMTSPSQLYPVLKMLTALRRLDPDQFRDLIVAYSSTLKTLNADSRSFAAATNASLMQELIGFARDLPQRQISPYPIIDAFRTYLVRHMSSPRCTEDDGSKENDSQLSKIIKSFNDNLQPLVADLAAITPDEVKPTKVEGSAKVYEFWQKPGTRKLLADLKALRFGTEEQQAINNQKPSRPDGREQFLTVEQRQDPEWEAQALDFLNEVEKWKGEHDETQSNYFDQVCFIYIPLVELMPPGALRDKVLASYIRFLGSSPIQKINPPEWYLEVNRLLNLQDAGPEDQARIRREILDGGDDVMRLYAEVAALERKSRAAN